MLICLNAGTFRQTEKFLAPLGVLSHRACRVLGPNLDSVYEANLLRDFKVLGLPCCSLAGGRYCTFPHPTCAAPVCSDYFTLFALDASAVAPTCACPVRKHNHAEVDSGAVSLSRRCSFLSWPERYGQTFIDVCGICAGRQVL